MRKRGRYRGDYGHKPWRTPRTWRIGFAIDDDNDELCFVFHGAFRHVLTVVFDRMRRMFGSYEIHEDFNWDFLNGKCYRGIEVRIANPDFGLMSVDEWPMMIGHYLKKTCRCEVIYYKSYDKFLNG